ncbi:HTH-type transcriptional regulator CynR [Paraconexibacter sp. AEG42_29]|uniref:HTH-type transcriptional regulator CynR n=1 Tax=Paraconexibacter sp. AEG42_29 TaxID=2997339 RepID=A0AAU7B2R7_9ACTN
MTLAQLEYFIAASEHGSFSAAAEHLHMAQPSLSDQVRRLEAEFGVQLFRRVGRGLVITEAGETLRAHATAVLDAAAAARESLSAARDLQGGTAVFGTFGSAKYFLGTDLVADFRERHPRVAIRLIGQNSVETAEAVRDGRLEAGIIAIPVDDRGLEVRPIARDEIVYASAVPERLKRHATIQMVAAAPLILPDATFGAEDPVRRQLAELAQRAGVRIEPVIDVEDVDSALELAWRGFGDTITSRAWLAGMEDRIPDHLGWVPFDPPLYDTFAFVWRRGAPLSPATRSFLQLAEERMSARTRELETEGLPRRRPARAAPRPVLHPPG